jgi:phosphate/sulfate permease/DNA-directed RNA polymerase specialized sigma24 family protein
MQFLIFLSSGLFLGWSLGANDAANIFGSAVGSKMIRFRRAALIASIFVVLGAVFQGRGNADTLSSLGAVDALAGGFTVSLCAAITVFTMTRYAIPVSTSQAIVGAIIGWSSFVGQATDYKVLSTIVSTWIIGPILGLIFAALLFLALRKLLRILKIHVVKLDAYIRISLIVVGAFGAYSLGANNIANVMGVFINSAPDVVLDFGLFSLDGVQLLFLIGGLAIATGIYTYSERVMNTVGNGILSLSSEAAIVVVLSQALVLFIFSSSSLSHALVSIGLPAIPLVPVSSTQVVVGSVIGIGMIKGAREIKYKTLGSIAMGWIITPLAAGLLTFIALFFVQNVFHLQVTHIGIENTSSIAPDHETLLKTSTHVNLIYPAVFVIGSIAIIVLIFLILRQQKLRLKVENALLIQQSQYFQAQKALSTVEVSTIQTENDLLNQKLEHRRREFANVAMNITNQKEFLQKITAFLEQIREAEGKSERDQKLNELQLMLRQKMSFTDETEEFYSKIHLTDREFRQKIAAQFPGITEQEKKLSMLLRLNLSSKEISSMLGISAKSVEISRYRLRKRLNLKQGENLIQFIQNL